MKLREIALRLGKSVPQVVLRWALQEGMAVLTRSSSLQHLQHNREIFDFELTLVCMLVCERDLQERDSFRTKF